MALGVGCTRDLGRFCECNGAGWVALAFLGDFVSAVALGAGCTRIFGRFCQCSGSWEWVALAIWSVFASAVVLRASCTRDLGRFCESSGAESGLHLHFWAFLRVQLVNGGIWRTPPEDTGSGGCCQRQRRRSETRSGGSVSGRDSPEGAYRSGELRRPRPTGGLLARRAVPVPGRGRNV